MTLCPAGLTLEAGQIDRLLARAGPATLKKKKKKKKNLLHISTNTKVKYCLLGINLVEMETFSFVQVICLDMEVLEANFRT
jgi:hypothetical protein